MLDATEACTFSTSELPKRERLYQFDCETGFALQKRAIFLTSKIGPMLKCLYYFDFEMCLAPQWRAIFHVSSPQGPAFRHFSEPLFDVPVSQNIGKTQRLATFLPFRAPASSFFWLFLFSDLLSSAFLFSESSHLCFSICPYSYCRKFDF